MERKAAGEKAFGLVELLVSLALIGILVMCITAMLSWTNQSSKKTQARTASFSDITLLSQSLSMHGAGQTLALNSLQLKDMNNASSCSGTCPTLQIQKQTGLVTYQNVCRAAPKLQGVDLKSLLGKCGTVQFGVCNSGLAPMIRVQDAAQGTTKFFPGTNSEGALAMTACFTDDGEQILAEVQQIVPAFEKGSGGKFQVLRRTLTVAIGNAAGVQILP